MASSSTITQQLINSSNDSALFDYMKQFVEYQETGVDLPELSQLRQLDIYLQNCYHHIQEYVTNLREKQYGTQTEANIQTKLIDALIQAKAIGDKKMQLSQQMLDITERQSKKLKLAHQKYIDSSNQQSTSSNDNDSDHEFDVEIHSTRSLTNKASTTSLWKRKATTTTTTTTTTPPASAATNNHNSTPSTLGLKRKCVVNSEQNIEQRERKKVTQRNCNSNGQNSCSGNQRKFKLNNDSSSTHSDEPTYCLCSQLSYGSMILCDSKSCEIKWFHFNCVNLTTKPKGKWYCPNCRDNRS